MQFNEPSWIGDDPINHLAHETILSYISDASAEPSGVQHLAKCTITIDSLWDI
jgi:hypothetical protein